MDRIYMNYYKTHECELCGSKQRKMVPIASVEPSLYVHITKQHGLWNLSLRPGNTTNKFWNDKDEWTAWARTIDEVVDVLMKYKGLAGKEGVVDISASNKNMKIHSNVDRTEQFIGYVERMLKGR